MQTTTSPAPDSSYLGRDETIARIRKGLKARSGKSWSVTGGRGTAWGWITVNAPPARCKSCHPSCQHLGLSAVNCPYAHYMSQAEAAELGALLGLGHPVRDQGESIPARGTYYREYVDRAEGRTPSVIGTPYWD